uniref:GPS domain-containing protein n=1 Tax=Panagrolaimus sp. ES5 TaxID=591445 RepID=A0AC34GP67_9BILA
MLFKNLLLLLTIVVPGIAQNSYTSLLIQGVRTMNADCANLLLSFKVQLRLDHRTNILDACENHTIIPQINMELNNISLCTNNNNSCSGITPTYTVPSASDIPWISLSYTFCNVTRLKTYFLWENDQFNVSTQRSNFVVSNSLGFISIRNCHAGYTLLTNFLFCIKETNDLDCNFQMSTHAPTTSATTPFPTRSTSNLPILTSTVSPFPNTSTSYFTSRNLTTMSPTTFSTTTSSVATTMPSTLHTTVRSTVTTTNSTTITSTTTTETNPTTTTNLATTDVTTIKPTSQSTSESSTYMTSTKNTATTLNTTIIASTTVTDTTTVTPTLSSTYVSTIISTNSRTSSTNTLPSSLTYPLSTPYPLSSPSTTTTTPSDSTSTKITSTTNSLPSTTLESTTPLISTSPTNNLTPSNSSPETSTLTTPQSTPFVPSQNPYDINCTNPDSDLDAIYCHVEATNYTASEISGIINNTINAVNITKLTPKEVFAVVGIFRRCSEINDLTHRAFTDMSRLVDEMLEAPSESYIQTHEVGIKTTQIILDSVNRVILNSPSDVSYLNGKNVALLGKVLNCGNNNKGDAGGLIDTGSGFDENDATTKTRASISIDGNVACAGQAHRVFYTIYRNSKFFIRTDPNQNANNYFYLNYAAAAIETTTTTQNSNKDTNQKCKPTVFGTDDSILSGTLITNNSTSAPSSASFIHSVAKEGINQNIVNIKFDKKHIGVFLHGKLGIRWWDIASNSWSSESCKVEEKDGFYISKCTHLTDFTLLVDGIQTDPILCNRVLEIVNYIVSIGSMFSLLILNVIYIIIL